MKWFRHETDAIHSEKLAQLILEFGFEGYGRYWKILELVAERMDFTSRCYLELPEKEWLRYLSVRRPLFRRYLVVICQLFNIKQVTTGLLLRIEIPNLLEKRDNYTNKLRATTNKLPSKEVEVEVEVDKPPPTPPRVEKFYSDQDEKTAQWMLDKILLLKPDFTGPGNIGAWALGIKDLKQFDDRTDEQIRILFEWANADPFWHSNILEPKELQRNWDKLSIKKNGACSGNGVMTATESALVIRKKFEWVSAWETNRNGITDWEHEITQLIQSAMRHKSKFNENPLSLGQMGFLNKALEKIENERESISR